MLRLKTSFSVLNATTQTVAIDVQTYYIPVSHSSNSPQGQVKTIMNNDDATKFYTGLPSWPCLSTYLVILLKI